MQNTGAYFLVLINRNAGRDTNQENKFPAFPEGFVSKIPNS
ncbi:hypothetical protein FCR2A7T_01940 [Flavobacterium cauense R2A-7]|nr:hypothetical protein FCR2A7T_01940 [Flavobacterium cauense R2A-7]